MNNEQSGGRLSLPPLEGVGFPPLFGETTCKGAVSDLHEKCQYLGGIQTQTFLGAGHN